jgi:peptidoglycan/LPS O-acetylase OafA/YrhL
MSLFAKTITSEKFPALTGMRAVAAFMVFFNHLSIKVYPHVLVSLQATFYTGVAFFFVLSGFLIAYRCYDVIEVKVKWKRDYIVKRFASIYPVYFLLVTIVILVNGNFDAVFLIQNYTLTHNPFFSF